MTLGISYVVEQRPAMPKSSFWPMTDVVIGPGGRVDLRERTIPPYLAGCSG